MLAARIKKMENEIISKEENNNVEEEEARKAVNRGIDLSLIHI